MRIAFVTPEVMPFVKTGGLADVALGLPMALAGLGVGVTVFCPLYRQVSQWLTRHDLSQETEKLPFDLWIGNEQHGVTYISLKHAGVWFVFIENDTYFDRAHPYLDAHGLDYPDNVARYSYFCRAVLEYYTHFAPVPDIFHVHDWQASLIPTYLKSIYMRPDLQRARCLLTLHNLGYQGLFQADQIYTTGLGWESFNIDSLEYYGKLNLLKGGILFSDSVNTVSPTYAQEIQSEEQGRGLHGVVKSRRKSLTGILNGIDTQFWNPETDPHLPAHYSLADLSGKQVCKKALQRALNLPIRPSAFLLGAISRFDTQKGIELIQQAFSRIAGLDTQLVVLGSGDTALEHLMQALAASYPEQVAVRLGYDEALAHLIEAGADAFLMPSLYEPCGLNQMYSQRYGTIPIVRETGGLKDTVSNFTTKRLAEGTASGFSFRAFDPLKLVEAIRRAATLFSLERRSWTKLMKCVMSIDHSWQASASAYAELYRKLANPAQLAATGATSE